MSLRRSIVILLSIVYFSGIFSPFYVYAGYLINRKYIADNLCENKMKPGMHCNGKCYLADKLAEIAAGENDAVPSAPAGDQVREISSHYSAVFTFAVYTSSGTLKTRPSPVIGVMSGSVQIVESPPEVLA